MLSEAYVTSQNKKKFMGIINNFDFNFEVYSLKYENNCLNLFKGI